MASGGNITLGLDFRVNKSGLNELTSILQQIEQQTLKIAKQEGMDKGLKETITTARELQKILNSSWNSNLNQLDLNRLNSNIIKSYGSLGNLRTQLNKIGADKAFDSLAKNILNTNVQIKQSNTLLDQMATTMANSVRWGIASSVINNVTNEIQSAWNYTKALDSSLNDIRIVTGKSAEEMTRFAREANTAAKALGASTKDYTNASLIYYQQGLSEEDVQARAQTTLKAANVTGQTGEEVSEQLTAVWNGYKVSAQETELYIDKLAAVAADTAADLEELSTGMSKVASAANIMGVDIDQLSAQLATIVSVTRQAPESVGTALKTIYARMGDIKAGLDGEVTLDEYTSQMKEMGVNVLDANGNLRDMGTVIEEIGSKWTSMSREQQISLSQTMAGTRQYNNLLSLFDNWDMYTETLNTSAKAAGTLQKQEEIYLESTSAHLQKLATEAEKTYDILFDQDVVNGFTDALTGALTVFNSFLNSFGGGFGSIAGLGSIATGLFSKQIASGIAGQMSKQQEVAYNQNLFASQEEVRNFYAAQGLQFNDAGLKAAAETYEKIRNVRHLMSEEEQTEYNLLQRKSAELHQQLDIYENFGKILKGIPGLGSGSNNKKTFSTDELDRWLTTNKTKLNKMASNRENADVAMGLLSTSGRLSDNKEYLKLIEKEPIFKGFSDITNKKDAIQALKELKDNLPIEEEKLLAIQIAKVTEARKLSTQATKENIEALKAQCNDVDNSTDKMAENYNTQLVLQEGIELVSSGLTAAISIWNLFSTAMDKNLSTTEKAKIIFSSLGTTIFSSLAFMKNLVEFQNAGGLKTLGTSLANFAVNLGLIDKKVVGTTSSFKIFGDILIKIMKKLGPYALILLGLAAAFGLIYKAINAQADATKKLEERVTELTTEYNQAKEAADNFKKSVSDYKEAKKELDGLVEGTQEYIDKVKEANELSLQILSENPDLATSVTRDKYGVLTFSDEALNEISKRQNQNATSIGLEKIQAQIDLSNDTIKNTLKDIDSLKVKNARTTEKINNQVLHSSQGNIDLTRRPIFKQDDGSISTVNSIIISDKDGKYVVIPTIKEDEFNKAVQMSDEEAEEHFISTREFLGKFDKLSEAEYYARDLHNSQDYLYNQGGLTSVNRNTALTKPNLDSLSNFFVTVDKIAKQGTAAFPNYLNQQNTSKASVSKKEMQDIYNSIADYAIEHNLKTITEEELVQIQELKHLETDVIKTLASEENIISLKGALNTLIQQKTLQKQYYIEANKIWIENNAEFNKYSELEKTFLANVMSQAKVNEEEVKKQRDDILNNRDSNALSYWDEKQLAQLDNKQKSDSRESSYANNAEILDRFKKSAKTVEGVDIYEKVLQGTLSAGNEIDLSDQMAELSPTEAMAFAEMDKEEFKEFFGITDEIIEAAGYDVVEKLQKAYENYDWTKEGAIKQALKSEDEYKEEGLNSEEVKTYVSHLMNVAAVSEEVDDALIENADAAEIVATSLMRMNKGIDTLADNFKDWNSILQKSEKTSLEYANAMSNIKDALADVLDTESEYIDQEFIKNHLSDIQKIATGDEEAIERVRLALQNNTLEKIIVSNKIGENLANDLRAQLNQVQDLIKNDATIQVGTELEGENEIISRMQNIIDAAQMTTSEANAMFANMGFEATYLEEPETTTYKVPEYTIEPEVKWRNEEGGLQFPQISFKAAQTGTADYEGTIPVQSMSVSTPDGQGTKTPTIRKLTKKATGGMNNYSSSNKGGGSPGKSGGGSDKKPDIKDPIEDEKDIYHDINIILKQISTELNRIEKQEEKLIGQDLIDNLNKQWEKLQDTINATNEKIKIAQGEMGRLQGILGSQGVAFNADGTIANYSSIYEQKLAELNAIINHYNSLSAEEQETYKETVEQAEKNWKEFVDNISEYDQLVSETIPELQDEIQEAIDKQIEIQIKKFNMEIELRLDMAEAERDWNEFKKKIIDGIEDDDILGNAKAKLLDYSSYYKEDGTGVIQKNTQHVNEIIEQLKSIDETGTSSIYGDNKAQALEDLNTYREQLMSDLTAVYDLVNEIKESYLAMMDEAQEKFDEQVETYEYIRDLLTHDMDLITMVYGDEAYDKLVGFYEKQEDNYNKQLDFQRQQKDFWKAQMDSLEEGSDEWQKAKENWMSAVEEWNSLVEEAIENLQDKYLNAINNIFAKLNDKVTGGLGLDYVEQEWDLINKNADQYLDTINAVFETQQLENKYLDAIDNTDSISAQRKLNDLMKEEITALEQKDKLTQYDIDRANLKYEIALKQIALEEAQQTKSSMRLRRDSQGNYRYEFVADNDAISEAENELSVLQNQLYNMDVEQYRNNLNQLYEIYVEWQEALAEAAQINDPEARAERELMINEQYGELINGIVEENEVIRNNLRESAFEELLNLHQMEEESFKSLSEVEKDIMLEEMVPQWNSGVQSMTDAFAGEGGFIPTCKDALEELDSATQDYENSLNELQKQGGFTFDDIVNGENDAINTSESLLQVNNELINSYRNELTAVNAVLNELQGLINKYDGASSSAKAAAESAYSYADALLAVAAAANGQYSGRGSFYSSSGGSSGGNSRTTSSSANTNNQSSTGGKNNTSNNSGSKNQSSTGRNGTYMVFDESGRTAGSVVFTNGSVSSTAGVLYLPGHPRKVYLTDGTYVGTYDTGGYTGEWNSSEGKIGILHQKELVLNKVDTENILEAVKVMRSVTNSIDDSVLLRIKDFISNTGISTLQLDDKAFEQNVHIEANFPNVQNSREIEDAIENLTNIAAQRASRFKK